MTDSSGSRDGRAVIKVEMPRSTTQARCPQRRHQSADRQLDYVNRHGHELACDTLAYDRDDSHSPVLRVALRPKTEVHRVHVMM